MTHRYVVIDIGCLECHNPTQYLGSFGSIEAAKKAHPSALTRQEQANKGWRGEGVIVILDTRKP